MTTCKEGEDALRTACQENARLASVVDYAPTGVTITDPARPDNPLIYANPAFLAMTGYAADEVVGRNCRFLQGDDTTPAIVDQLRAAIHTQRPFVGILRNYRKDGTPFWNDLRVNAVHDASGRLIHFVGIQTDISDRVHLDGELQHLALHDALTGLPNRALLRDRIGQVVLAAERSGEQAALLLLDLDRFKDVNDALGHGAGDALLVEVGHRLRAVLRPDDTVARLGGDEFAVLLPGARRGAAEVTAVQIARVLAAPIVVDTQSVVVAASIGVALYPVHGADAATLMRRADVAMYQAKRSGRSHAVYAPEQDAHTRERLALIDALRCAIDDGGLVLHYQPMVEIATGQVHRVEALVRWPRSETGVLLPDAFIPLAEQSGLIGPLTRWVLREALAQCCAWRDARLAVGVNINFSMLNLGDSGLSALTAQLLHDDALPASALRIELTESAIITDVARTEQMLRALSEMGVRIAIDDYGTGYSSLAYLKRLPVDELKIDKSFVRGMVSDRVDDTIVASTIGLGHSLGLRVVAEGVEDQATLERLGALGCDAVQGYYVSRPLPPDDLERWLRARQSGGGSAS